MPWTINNANHAKKANISFRVLSNAKLVTTNASLAIKNTARAASQVTVSNKANVKSAEEILFMFRLQGPVRTAIIPVVKSVQKKGALCVK